MKSRLGIIALVTCLSVVACTTQGKVIAKTVNEAARVACEAAFGKEQLPAGITLEELCKDQERLQPFIDAILGARNTVAEGFKREEAASGGK